MLGSWWREGVIYQIYPRSFADSNGDGIGDLTGITERLGYLSWLGVDAVWLNPIMPSPNADWGYDVADYCDVHPDLGTLADLDRLVAAAGKRGMAVLLDLVPNHTSDRHSWFVESRSSRDAEHRDWYVWADPGPGGAPPSNWVSVFGGPAWTLDEATGQYYLHNFLPEQPDLNWWSEDVRRAFDDVLRFWFERRIAGFRIDVAHAMIKDSELRDNPSAEESDDDHDQRLGQQQVYNMHRPEVHELHRRFRSVADGFGPPRVLLGETWARTLEDWARYYGDDDELQLNFNFPFAFAPLEASGLRSLVEATEHVLPAASWPVWTLSNHDIGRFPSRLAGGDERKARCALLILLTLRGTPVLYYGDEIGMLDGGVSQEQARDPVGRDPARTPMQWSAEEGAGFTTPGIEPWLPVGDAPGRSVAAQRDDPGSMLSFCRRLIELRRESEDLRAGAYRSLPAPLGVWAWQRGEGTTVAVNLWGRPATLEGVSGAVLAGTRAEREGEQVTGGVTLRAWEGVLLENRGE